MDSVVSGCRAPETTGGGNVVGPNGNGGGVRWGGQFQVLIPIGCIPLRHLYTGVHLSGEVVQELGSRPCRVGTGEAPEPSPYARRQSQNLWGA